MQRKPDFVVVKSVEAKSFDLVKRTLETKKEMTLNLKRNCSSDWSDKNLINLKCFSEDERYKETNAKLNVCCFIYSLFKK